MPKNNHTLIKTWCFYYDCPCGARREFQDEKTMVSSRERHSKYCVVYKKAEEQENIQYINDRYKVGRSTAGKKERTDTDVVNFFEAMNIANSNVLQKLNP